MTGINSEPVYKVVEQDGQKVTQVTLNLSAVQSVFIVDEMQTLPGDVNNNGEITVTDIVTLRGFISGDQLPDNNQFAAGDLNNDKVLTVTDIVALRTLITG